LQRFLAAQLFIYGRAVLLHSDDVASYEAHVSSFFARYRPAADEENTIVQSFADTEWRLNRIPSLEMGIYAAGRVEFANLFPHEESEVRKHLIEAKIFLAYQRQVNNLSIQESRLRLRCERDAARLRELQEIRKRREKELLDEAAEQYIQAVNKGSHEH
jgi:hypothetical protein